MNHIEVLAVIVVATIIVSIIIFSALIGHYDPSGPSSRDSNGYKK